MKLKSKFFITITIIAIILIGCSENKNDKSTNESEEKTQDINEVIKITLSSEVLNKFNLEFGEVKQGTINGIIKAPAKLIANQDLEAQVGSLIPGRVHRVLVKEGDFVKEGQILMYVESIEFGEILSAYLKAKSNLDYYKVAFERQKKLIEQNVGSQKTFLEAKADYEKALAEYDAEDKRIHSIGLEHSDIETNVNSEHLSGLLPIKAPISGIITERNVVIGQYIEVNIIAFKIIDISNLWSEGQVYEKDLTKISGKPKVKFITSTYPDEKFKGEVILIGQTIDEHSRTIKVRASLQNTNNKLKPNMFGELLIQINSNTKGMIIPTDAIIKEGNKSYVFVVENDSTFEKRMIETGFEYDGMSEIISGLKKDEKIVMKGAFFLKSEFLKGTLGEGE